MSPAVRIRGLRKQYGSLQALAGVDLDIEPGEVFALLGPNGAGKTTLVEILEGYRDRTAGDVSVLGQDPRNPTVAWKARIGIVLQSTNVFDALTVEEVVRHFAAFYPHPMPVDRAISLVGLEPRRRARCKSLSGGQKRRVDLALGLIGDPELVFLDEPTTGFDPAARRQAWDVVRGLTSLGKTVLLTTHYLDEAENLANRVGVIVAGKLVEVGSPREVGGRARAMAHVRFVLDGALAGRQLPKLPGELRAESTDYVVVTNQPTAVVRALAEWASSFGLPEIPGLQVTRPSLEDVYLQLIAQHESGAGAEQRR
jgi:ABC-2 type transport system ATP-binding protein